MNPSRNNRRVPDAHAALCNKHCSTFVNMFHTITHHFIPILSTLAPFANLCAPTSLWWLVRLFGVSLISFIMLLFLIFLHCST